jgi:hypothetical protein
MSEPSADPPVPPSQPPTDDKGEGSSAGTTNVAASPAEGESKPETAAEDVKMEEDKPKEDTFEDIPEGVLNVGVVAYPHCEAERRVQSAIQC